MRAPEFWQRGGVLPALLGPASALVAGVTARRVARPGWRAPVPVICCGNVGVGGAGKTTLVLDLAARLVGWGLCAHLLTRGYGGRARGPLRVELGRHDARAVGDEALLLAACAPTWVGGDRAASARLAVAAGAQVLVMDDGLQNPSLVQDCGLLVVDGEVGFGNGRVMPAGPLREPVRAAAGRVAAAVLIGADRHGAAGMLLGGLPILRAGLVPGVEVSAYFGRRVLAFAGIGRPGKFFDMLEGAGVEVVERVGLADHHAFRAGEVAELVVRAARQGAGAVTTPKDYARIGAEERAGVGVVGVTLAWEDAQGMEELLRRSATK